MVGIDVNLSLLNILWVVSGLFSSFYMIRNLRKTRRLINHYGGDTGGFLATERYIVTTRYEREIILFGVEAIFTIAGIASILMPVPIIKSVGNVVTIIIPIALIIGQLGLSFHAFLIHVHYENALAILSREYQRMNSITIRTDGEQ